MVRFGCFSLLSGLGGCGTGVCCFIRSLRVLWGLFTAVLGYEVGREGEAFGVVLLIRLGLPGFRRLQVIAGVIRFYGCIGLSGGLEVLG